VSLDPALATNAVSSRRRRDRNAESECEGHVLEQGAQIVLGLSVGLLGGQDGQPSGVLGVLRPLGDAAAEFVATEEGSA
jgi:hypothetical protein